MKPTRHVAPVFSFLCFFSLLANAFRGGSVNERFRKLKQAEANRHLAGHFAGKLHGGKPSANLGKIFAVKQHSIEIPMDHRQIKGTNGTFMNRYWVYDRYYQVGGPIFFYDAGEQNLAPYAADWLKESFLTSFLEEFKGMGIAWEHRYYGESWVLPRTNITTPLSELQYLSVGQALEDINYFANRFKSERFPDYDKTPKGTPWVYFGTSYAGARASFMRQKFPDTVFAAYSSSAPVQARADLSGFFEKIAQGISKRNPACFNNLHSAIIYIDSQLDNNKTKGAIKDLFLGPGGRTNSNGDFAQALSSHFWWFQNGGLDHSSEDASFNLSSLCTHINSDEDNQASPVEGWEKSKGSMWIAKRWASYPHIPDIMQYYFGARCGGYHADPKVAYSCQLNKIYPDSDNIAWAWQYCTELGWFQTGAEGQYQIVSKYNNLETWRKGCRKQFELSPGALGGDDLLSTGPSTGSINFLYGGWYRPQPRTFYTIPELDPWGVVGFHPNDTNAPLYNISNEIPSCEAAPPKDRIFGHLMQGGLHSQDLMEDKLVGKHGFDLFKKALHTWLPCFRKARNLTKPTNGTYIKGGEPIKPAQREGNRSNKFKEKNDDKLHSSGVSFIGAGASKTEQWNKFKPGNNVPARLPSPKPGAPNGALNNTDRQLERQRQGGPEPLSPSIFVLMNGTRAGPEMG
ncbi:hypothetical protein DRE_04385 [Drechslerella stenobrocha 248]|uniref:Serine carboxypeptidase S28 n=1 Tax=Drechslerella stenobrocha 248 TaxID=1043628 RepID=W7I1Q5_9PEZI|nr:hypothetical protein DRE_04385 [Drechslerella stenobrocha 248]